nr:MAG TPA: hypothetical protein [Caudoviricetes sp.]
MFRQGEGWRTAGKIHCFEGESLGDGKMKYWEIKTPYPV